MTLPRKSNYPPRQIALCAATGDWWPLAEGVECPHVDCASDIVFYTRTSVRTFATEGDE